MSTPGMQWAQLLTQMGGQTTDAILGGMNAGTQAKNAGTRQQEVQLQEQQEQRAAQQQDMEMHQHLIQMGAKPGDAATGLIKEDQPLPDMSAAGVVGMPNTVSIMRKMDPERMIKFKDATGGQVAYELPTRAEQIMNQMNQARGTAQAQAEGTAAGQPQVATTADYNDQMGLPPATSQIPVSAATNLAGKYIPASVRQQTAEEGIASREKISSSNAQAAQTRLAQTLNWKSTDAQNQATVRDAISRRQSAVQAGLQPNLAPIKLRAFNNQIDAAQKAAEQQRGLIDQAVPLLDESKTPDGTQFTNPFTGSQMQMTPGVRMLLGDRANLATQQVDSLHKQLQSAAGIPDQQTAQQGTGSPQAAGGARRAAPADPVAQAIANYQLAPPSTRSTATAQGRALMTRVLGINPEYDGTQFPNRSKTRQAFTTGTQGQQANSMNTAIGHLDQMSDAMKGLDNSNVQVVNQAKQWFSTQFGGAAATNFNTLKVAVSGELASVLKKSGATDSEIKNVESTINSKNSPAQLSGYIDTQIPILGSKLSALNYQYHQAMGEKDPFSALSPEAKGVLTKRGFDPNNPRVAGAGGGQGQIKVTDPKGGVHTFPDQASADRFKKLAGIQ